LIIILETISTALNLAAEAYQRRRTLFGKLAPVQFLREEPGFLADFYREEPTLKQEWIPYQEIANWMPPPGWGLEDGTSIHVGIERLPQNFRLETGGDDHLKEFQVDALREFKASGRMSRNSQIVRLAGVSDDGTCLTVQKAMYSDQVQSNLVMDWSGPHALSTRAGCKTLRAYINARHPGRLPPLSDKRLANTIGIATIIFYKDAKGILRPYLPLRVKGGLRKSRRLAVMEGSFASSASAAARWIDEAESFNDLLTADMMCELDQEVGIKPHDLEFLIPVALCREFLRCGKPEVFFVGLTSLGEEDLVARRRHAMHREKSVEDRKVEVEDTHLDFGDPSRMEKQIKKYGILPEASANLEYARQVMDRFH